jgi:hypothetical protein
MSHSQAVCLIEFHVHAAVKMMKEALECGVVSVMVEFIVGSGDVAEGLVKLAGMESMRT